MFKPLSAVCLSALVLIACDLSKSEEVVAARVGQDLDQVIADWGFPSGEREVAGRKLVYWEETEVSYDGVPTLGLELPIGGGEVSADIALGKPRELRCRREVQVDKRDQVVAASISGDNCPYYAPNGW